MRRIAIFILLFIWVSFAILIQGARANVDYPPNISSLSTSFDNPNNPQVMTITGQSNGGSKTQFCGNPPNIDARTEIIVYTLASARYTTSAGQSGVVSFSPSNTGQAQNGTCVVTGDGGAVLWQYSLGYPIATNINVSGLSAGIYSLTVTVTNEQGLSANKTVNFTINRAASLAYTLTTSINSGSGTTTGPGISCPGDCSETYSSGTWVTLIATPASNYTFGDWLSGSGTICADQSSTCSALIDGNKTAGVNFNTASSSPPVYGCTDSTATNYNSSATNDDGSCTYPPPPPGVVNGVCSSTHYNCSAGSLGATAEYSDQWQWWCNGSGGGDNALCSESKSGGVLCADPIATNYGGAWPCTYPSAPPPVGGAWIQCGLPGDVAYSGQCSVSPGGSVTIYFDCIPAGSHEIIRENANLVTEGDSSPNGYYTRLVTPPYTGTTYSNTCDTGNASVIVYWVTPPPPPPPPPPPVAGNVTINPKPITANGASIYNITVTATDANGGADIINQYAVINHQGANAGAYRGYVRWTSGLTSQTFVYNPSTDPVITCAPGGGSAGELSGNLGDAYINLTGCSTSVSGNTRTTIFTVSFNPVFTTPLTNNTLSALTVDTVLSYAPWTAGEVFNLVEPEPFNYSLSNSGTSNVTKTSGNAFTQNTITKTLILGGGQSVTLSLSGVPANTSYSIAAGTCSPTCTSVITFTVPSSTRAGTYLITVTGSPLSKQTSFNLVVSGNPITVSCSASPMTATLGQTVTWTAAVSGGTPPFTYSWSGTNIPSNPAPNTNPFSISYGTIGQKIAIATVTDADSMVASCGGAGGGTAGTIFINFDPHFEEF